MSTLFSKNTDEFSISVSSFFVYHVEKEDVDVVTIENISSINNSITKDPVRFKAFKYNLSGDYYWYVIDDVHKSWTSDLSEWGYKEISTSIPMGGIISETSSSSFLFPLQGMEITVDNISLVGNKPSFGGFIIVDNISLVGNKPSFGGFVTQDLTI